jgi:hypothetical protein
MAAEVPAGSQVRIDGATPNGGAYSVAYYYDHEKNPVPRARARHAEIVEFSSWNRVIHRTYIDLVRQS